ncbi:MAG TPA: NmrA family NAD(P)-binding protein, partial [Nitrospiraceae bacterium]|nr:NmrA family NAD(P)-binding protein [Nitrospiraceae bacterium]
MLVIGATGLQGGAVVRHLLTTGRYEVRCLTRNPRSLASLALAEAEAELFKGDLDEIETIEAALQGCDAVFGVTDYWEHFEREFDQGRNLIDAIRHSNVQHTILSTLPDAKGLSGGKLEVPPFDTKARIQHYARERELSATYLHM